VAAQQEGITVEGSVDGTPVADADSNDPVQVQPDRPFTVELTVDNSTDRPVTVRRARLFGRAFGVTFVAYDALVDARVPAGGSTIIEVPVEFVDLERQATGLLPGGFAVYGEERELLAEQEFVIDVRGSMTSALGLLGIFVILATVLGVVGIVLAVRRGTLGPSRLRRAARFGAVGLGVGISAVVALAVFRVLAPTGAVWLPITVLPAIAGAILGWVSPGPLRIEDEEWDDDVEESLKVAPPPEPPPVTPPAVPAETLAGDVVPPGPAPSEVPDRQVDRPTQA
jgi:hypothetical protein